MVNILVIACTILLIALIGTVIAAKKGWLADRDKDGIADVIEDRVDIVKDKIDKFYEGEFLITHLRHNFDQGERMHTMFMSVVKDSIPVQFKNILSGKEPVRSKGRTINY